MKVVIALGGNAILKKGESPRIETQIRNTRRALTKLFPVIRDNKVVITHGNGPAVGYLLLQQELAKNKVAAMPLDVLDAETEGQLGYLIQQNLQNLFRKRGQRKGIATVLSQVLVDSEDKAFKNLTKFVGPFYSRSQADALRKRGFVMKEDSGRGFRRVVASPKPIAIIESKIISRLLGDGVVTIAAGGGGIPVINKDGQLRGIEAVVDKDLASACLANSIKADTLIIVTDIDRVYTHFHKKNEKGIKKIRAGHLKILHEEGHFPPGSMGPKVKAAINFLEKNRKAKKVIITNVDNIQKALQGKAGTIVVK